MRRLTIWITATLAVIALVIAYQFNATGVSAKSGDRSAPSSAATSTNGSTTPSDLRGTNDQSGKAGENK